MGRGTEPRVSSALGSRGDRPRTLVVLPAGMLGSPTPPALSTLPARTSGSCRVQSRTPWTSWGQQSPGSPADGRGGGLSLWPAGQLWEMGQPWAPAPRGGGCSQTRCVWSANTPPGVSAALGVFGAQCVPKPAAQGRTPLPQDTGPQENLLVPSAPLQGQGSPL